MEDGNRGEREQERKGQKIRGGVIAGGEDEDDEKRKNQEREEEKESTEGRVG